MPVPARAAITGWSRRISSSGATLLAATLLAAAPSSTMSAPSAARRRACAIAAAGSRKRPPSENESAVMLTIPTRSGRGIKSDRASAFEDRADRFGIGKDVELLDLDPDMPDTRIGKTRVADPRGEALAQIDMPGRRDLADRRHDLFVIDDAPAVLARNAGFTRRRQLDRHPHPLLPVALGAADPDAAHQDKAAHDDRIALRAVSLNLRFHGNLGRRKGRPACGANSANLQSAATSSTSPSGSSSAPRSPRSSTPWSTT